MFFMLFSAAMQENRATGRLRIPLALNDQFESEVSMNLSFESENVTKAMAGRKIKLPTRMPKTAKVGVLLPADFFVVLEPIPGKEAVYLTVDANRNGNLRDDARIELAEEGTGKPPVQIKIKRTYPGDSTREAWLPYQFAYDSYTNRKGENQESIFLTPHYRREGVLAVNGVEYTVNLHDFNCLGKFDKNNLSRGTVLQLFPKKQQPDSQSHWWGYELIPIGEEFYEVADQALDGSWIEFQKTELPTAAIGKPAPDFTLTDSGGKSFKLSDYRGQTLLLDFWPSWCKPCKDKFPAIKEMLKKYSQHPLAVIGINLDAEKLVPEALKVIAEYQLPWRQVVEGKGNFHPLYRVFGRLPEHRSTFPVYVVIDESGVVRYATNDYANLVPVLDRLLLKTEGGLILPLRHKELRGGHAYPVDFRVARVEKLKLEKNLKLPEPMPKENRLGVMTDGTFVMVAPGDSAKQVKLAVDQDRNNDLTNDKAETIDLSNINNSSQIYIKTTYEDGNWRYLRYEFRGMPGRSPDNPYEIYSGPGFSFHGEFFLEDREYWFHVTDPTMDGRFQESDFHDNRAFQLLIREDAKWKQIHTGSDLIPLGGKHYRVHRIAENGSWIDLEESALTPAVINRAAPDFTLTNSGGKPFKISDYRGQTLLLDFWPAWCKPCVEKFPAIKKMVATYQTKKLAVVGINLDEPRFAAAAKKAIADHQISWPQVMELKGFDLPVYQVYSRLAEHQQASPVYVVIDPQCVVRFATNVFEKLERFLAAFFAGEIDSGRKLMVCSTLKSAGGGEPAPFLPIATPQPIGSEMTSSSKLVLPSGLAPNTRLGRLPNGIPFLLAPGKRSDSFLITIDEKGDGDLTNDPSHPIPVVPTLPDDTEAGTKVLIYVRYRSDAAAMFSPYFIALATSDTEDSIRLYFRGLRFDYQGTIPIAGEEYLVRFSDPTYDAYLTTDDLIKINTFEILTQTNGEWIGIHKGISGIPIGGRRYKLASISADGGLVELTEETKQP